ncbi:MAG: diguanylate cyclase [Pseudomonadota bacterium]
MSGRILFFDTVATNRIVLRCKLSAACYEVLPVADTAGLEHAVQNLQPDLVLIGQVSGTTSPEQIIRRISADDAMKSVPIVAMAATSSAAKRISLLDAGAAEVLSRPVADDLLLAHMRRLLRARTAVTEMEARYATHRRLGLCEAPQDFAAQRTVAIIAADMRAGMSWRNQLSHGLSSHIALATRDQALGYGGDYSAAVPDVFLIPVHLHEWRDGLRLLSELRSRRETRHSRMVVVIDRGATQGGTPDDMVAMAADLGADDLLSHGFDADEAALRINRQLQIKRRGDLLRQMLQSGLELALRDPLTGLFNRRYALPHLDALSSRSQADGQSFALMLLDIDHFKSVNDTYGHAAGDAVLKEMARRLQTDMREQDLCARIGGEEFLIAMPSTGYAEARAAAVRIAARIRETTFSLGAGADLAITVSIGIAMGGPGQPHAVKTLLEKADFALYASKADGRDQVTMSRPAA